MRWLVILLAAMPLLASGCSRLQRTQPIVSASQAAQTPAMPSRSARAGTVVEEISSSGQVRQYRLHLPANSRPNQSLALVVNLHGFNSDAEQQEQGSQMSAKADTAGFIVVYPQGLGEPASWRFGSRPEAQADIAFIRALVQHLTAQYAVDPQRVFVTGISNGAEMTYRLACDAADVFAAVGMISGGYPPFRDCQPARPVPAVLFHGTADRLLPYEGHPPLMLSVRDWSASWAARNGCDSAPGVTYQKGKVQGETWGHCRQGADVVLYTIEGKGHSWPGSRMPEAITTQDIIATDTLWQFFTAHPKP